MRLLLDECLPVELAENFPGHTVRTIRQMGWLGVQNGRLLRLIGESGQFDVFVTVDRNLPYQQNLNGLPFTIAVLRVRSTRLIDVLAQAPELLSRLSEAQPGQAIVIALRV